MNWKQIHLKESGYNKDKHQKKTHLLRPHEKEYTQIEKYEIASHVTKPMTTLYENNKYTPTLIIILIWSDHQKS